MDRFVVVGPQSFPYGTPGEILDFLQDEGCQWAPREAANMVVKLSGGGETYHAIVISCR